MSDPRPGGPASRFSGDQEAVIQGTGPELWVTAAAGSGKTGCLVERLARRLEQDPESAAGMLAFTFTRKAAQEMVSRLRPELLKRGNREAARALDRLRVGTIDSFCAQALREHAVEAGLDPRFEVLDPVEGELLERQSARRALEEAATRDLPEVRPWLIRYEEPVLSGCLIDVARALRSAGDPALLLDQWEAGEGSSFEAYSEDFERRKVELQHARLAAVRADVEQAAEHASRKPEQTALAHQALARLAGPAWDPAAWKDIKTALNASTGPRALAADFKVAREAAWSELGAPRGIWKILERHKGEFQDQELYQHLRAFVPLLRRHLEIFADAKARLIPPRLDFQDVMLGVLSLAGTSPGFDRFCGERLKHLLVDELQDVNGLQSQLIDTLGRSAEVFGVGDPMQSIYRFRHADVELFTARLAGAGGSGGAARELLENYRSRPGIVALVNALFPAMERALPGDGAPPLFRPLGAKRGPGEAPGRPVELWCVREERSRDGAPARELRLAEARVVAARLWELHESGFPVPEKGARPGEPEQLRPLQWRDCAVLFRAATAIPAFARALAEAGIPVETLHQSELLESVEGRDLLALLQVLHNPLQDLPLAAVLRSPLVDLGDAALLELARLRAEMCRPGEGRVPLFDAARSGGALARLAAAWPADAARLGRFLERVEASRDRVLTAGASGLLREWLDRTGYLAREGTRRAGDQVAANLRAFVERCREVEPSRGDLAGLLERLASLGESTRGPREGAVPAGRGVQLLTIHSAKGLEFPVAVVAQLGRRWKNPRSERSPVALRFAGLPRRAGLAARMGATFGDDRNLRGWAEVLLAADEERDERLEELRLCYVAMTRAREKLILAGTQVARKEGEPVWADGYGAWLEAALQQVRQDGVDLDPVLECTEVRAAGVRAPGSTRDRARSLWDLQRAEIGAGAPLPVDVDSDFARQAEQLLERVAKPARAAELAPRDIGAADLGRALLCPWQFAYREYLDDVTGNVARGAGTAGGEAAERGTRIHAFFEHWDTARGPLEDFERAAGLAGLTEDDRHSLREWLGNPALAGALADLGQPGAGLCREWMFEWSVNGTRISGRLDALARRPDGSWQVVDFKTDASHQLEPVYESQTGVYAAAVERAGMGRVSGRRLIYLRLGEVVDLPWGADDSDLLERKAAETLLLLGQGDAMDAPACPGCALREKLGRACPPASPAASPNS